MFYFVLSVPELVAWLERREEGNSGRDEGSGYGHQDEQSLRVSDPDQQVYNLHQGIPTEGKGSVQLTSSLR
jgi:hypothetical protein